MELPKGLKCDYLINKYIYIFMKTRNRKRYSEMSEITQSHEELKSKKTFQLPKIKKKKNFVFMDDVSISEDYIKIS